MAAVACLNWAAAAALADRVAACCPELPVSATADCLAAAGIAAVAVVVCLGTATCSPARVALVTAVAALAAAVAVWEIAWAWPVSEARVVVAVADCSAVVAGCLLARKPTRTPVGHRQHNNQSSVKMPSTLNGGHSSGTVPRVPAALQLRWSSCRTTPHSLALATCRFQPGGEQQPVTHRFLIHRSTTIA